MFSWLFDTGQPIGVIYPGQGHISQLSQLSAALCLGLKLPGHFPIECGMFVSVFLVWLILYSRAGETL